jgi:acetyl-CoA carboxylase carboxyltransferase component
VDVAERAHLDHGRRAGGKRPRHGQGRLPSKEAEEKFKAPIREQYERQGHPYYASARLWDDGVVDPADTRRLLGLAISASLNAPVEDTRFAYLGCRCRGTCDV